MRNLFITLLLVATASPSFAGTSIDPAELCARVESAIGKKFPSPHRYKARLSDQATAAIPSSPASGEWKLAALTYHPAKKSFIATVSIETAPGSLSFLKLNGQADTVMTIPVLTRDMTPGETIRHGDIAMGEVSANRSNPSMIKTAADLTGQVAKRPLRANTPVFTYDISKAILIKKGDLVTLTYALPGIELTAQGQATANAGFGDTISILNTRSRRTIEARVTGSGTATVTAPGPAVTASR